MAPPARDRHPQGELRRVPSAAAGESDARRAFSEARLARVPLVGCAGSSAAKAAGRLLPRTDREPTGADFTRTFAPSPFVTQERANHFPRRHIPDVIAAQKTVPSVTRLLKRETECVLIDTRRTGAALSSRRLERAHWRSQSVERALLTSSPREHQVSAADLDSSAGAPFRRTSESRNDRWQPSGHGVGGRLNYCVADSNRSLARHHHRSSSSERRRPRFADAPRAQGVGAAIPARCFNHSPFPGGAYEAPCYSQKSLLRNNLSLSMDLDTREARISERCLFVLQVTDALDTPQLLGVRRPRSS
ncbi:hypothetical protein HPB50_018512 [Hyalomma asiaticum]|uniref:Uncharacterized protein n=1 Tax=Hyalomma asiaticum TaxID=266040 RepID=A0ACB7TMW9_HYAAI|nr:hypothetical protein HPB50_018512 [Hyalomma asiaticum]